jgi:hypothetical protein
MTQTDDASDTAMTGGCFCSAIRFRAEPPSLWCAHCHCTMCRRCHGAPFVTWVGVAEDRCVVWSRSGGEGGGADPDALVWFQSSAQAQRGFCRRCGTTLFFRSPRWPGELHITRANFDSPVDREPAAHVSWETRAEWFPFEDGLPHKSLAD